MSSHFAVHMCGCSGMFRVDCESVFLSPTVVVIQRNRASSAVGSVPSVIAAACSHSCLRSPRWSPRPDRQDRRPLRRPTLVGHHLSLRLRMTRLHPGSGWRMSLASSRTRSLRRSRLLSPLRRHPPHASIAVTATGDPPATSPGPPLTGNFVILALASPCMLFTWASPGFPKGGSNSTS